MNAFSGLVLGSILTEDYSFNVNASLALALPTNVMHFILKIKEGEDIYYFDPLEGHLFTKKNYVRGTNLPPERIVIYDNDNYDLLAQIDALQAGNN